MNAMRRRLLRLATLLGAIALLWACNAPYIPVPPPGASFTTQLVDDGMGGQKTVWITHGLPYSNAAMARFFIFNEMTGSGVITTAAIDGTYTAPPIDGTMGDRIQISYQPSGGGDYSESTCLLLSTELVGSSAPRCPPAAP